MKGHKLILFPVFFSLVLGFQNCEPFLLQQSLEDIQTLSRKKTSNKFSCDEPELRGTTEGHTRRLTHDELTNSIQNIFGAKVSRAMKKSFLLYSPEVFEQEVDEFKPEHNRGHVNAIVEIAVLVGEKASEIGGSFFPKCLLQDKSSPPNFNLSGADCNQQFIQTLGELLFRRPLTTEQTGQYVSILETNTPEFTNDRERVAASISAMILDPNFLMHLSHAQPEIKTAKRVAVDQFTIASRLSFRLTGAGPDTILLEAAKNDQLRDLNVLKNQAQRLIESPLGRSYVRSLFSHWLKIGQEPGPSDVYAKHLNVSSKGLVEAMREEALTFAEHIVYEKKGSFQDLVRAEIAFPSTQDLAKIMKTEVSTGVNDPKVTRDGRKGLYMRPVLMLSPETRTSVIHRGYVFNKQFLCRQIPQPDDNDLIESEKRLEGVDVLKMTAREEAAYATAPASCMSCHSTINPPGFAMEAFGPFGETRDQEDIFDGDGLLVRSLPIDDSLTGFPLDGTPQNFSSLSDFHEALAFSQDSQACFGQKMFRFSRLQMENPADNCHLAAVETLIRENESIISVLIQNAVTEDILWQSLN